MQPFFETVALNPVQVIFGFSLLLFWEITTPLSSFQRGSIFADFRDFRVWSFIFSKE